MKSHAHHPAIADKIQWLRDFLTRWDPESIIASGAADSLLEGPAPARILALGKAGRALARAASHRLPAVPGFLLETRHGAPGPIPSSFQHYQGDHPLPGKKSREATQALYGWLQKTDGPLLALISGGGSALLSDPMPPWTVSQTRAMERTLLYSGAPIAWTNIVRARLSGARGGGLRARLGNAPVYTGVWCDMASPDWKGTSSWPTFSTPHHPTAETILRRLGVVPPHPLPPPLYMELGKVGRSARLADSDSLARDCVRELRLLGWNADRITCQEGTLPGSLATQFASAARQVRARPTALVSSGESPVLLTGQGRGAHSACGGRCSHLAAAVALELIRDKGWTFAAIATDGVDGNAGGGAILSWRDRYSAKELRQALLACASGSLFGAGGHLLPRRATGNNLRDLWVLFLE